MLLFYLLIFFILSNLYLLRFLDLLKLIKQTVREIVLKVSVSQQSFKKMTK
jgi:hypothetical protein